jgi:methyltransferase (TIGR00027 family)
MFKKLIFSLFSLIFQIFLFLAPVPSYAVLLNTPSWTAENVASYRALGAYEQDEKIRNPDYLAEKFVSPEYWDSSTVNIEDVRNKTWKRGLLADCIYYAMTARTKHFDSVLKEEGAKGIKQVVNFGAGYDTRAYRFHETMPNVKFFELDMLAMIARKKEIVAKIFGALPSYVIYIAINFEKQSLEDALMKAGYDKTKKTLFIWEGVTYYLTAEAVDGTLKFIAEQSAPGSSVIFDYCLKPVIDGDYSVSAKDMMKYVERYGEPYVYGIDPRKLRGFLKDRGFELLSDIGPDEMEKMYLIDSNGSVAGEPCGYWRFSHAVITKKH